MKKLVIGYLLSVISLACFGQNDSILSVISNGHDCFNKRNCVCAEENYKKVFSTYEKGGVSQDAAKLCFNRYVYCKRIHEGDSLFALKYYEQAKKAYDLALEKVTDDAYAKKQSDTCGKLIPPRELCGHPPEKKAEDEVLEKSFKELVSYGDMFLAKKDYISANKTYNQALNIKKGDPAVTEKIKKCEKLQWEKENLEYVKIYDQNKNFIYEGTRHQMKNYTGKEYVYSKEGVLLQVKIWKEGKVVGLSPMSED